MLAGDAADDPIESSAPRVLEAANLGSNLPAANKRGEIARNAPPLPPCASAAAEQE